MFPFPSGSSGIAVGCLLAWRAAFRTGLSGDVFWHRAAGVWMLNHHKVMTRDVFSYPVFGHSWITPEWGYSVVLAESVRVIGPVAFWLLSGGVTTLTAIAVALRWRWVGAGWHRPACCASKPGALLHLALPVRSNPRNGGSDTGASRPLRLPASRAASPSTRPARPSPSPRQPPRARPWAARPTPPHCNFDGWDDGYLFFRVHQRLHRNRRGLLLRGYRNVHR
jgi:hypothetical protein